MCHPVFSETVYANDREFLIEVHLAESVAVPMSDEYEAAFIGAGESVRIAVENAVNSLYSSPYEEFWAPLECAIQEPLDRVYEAVNQDGCVDMLSIIRVKK